jgi:hypothetical protein
MSGIGIKRVKILYPVGGAKRRTSGASFDLMINFMPVFFLGNCDRGMRLLMDTELEVSWDPLMMINTG